MLKEERALVQALELELLNFKTRTSPKRLNELLADDFFEFRQSGGASNKVDIVKILPTRPEEVFETRDMQSRVLTDDCILLHYIADRKVLESGEQKTTFCSSIWKKREEKWQMIFFQGTSSTKNEQ
jgi:hypothetical protein